MKYNLHCAYCEKEFKYESEKRRHEQSHNPHFQCEICTKKFSFLSALRRHQKQHQRTGKVECTQCHRNFRDDSLLKRHIRYAHKGTYICKKCSAEFHSELALSTHEKIHNAKSERKYHCRYKGCEKTFNFPHHLKHHELTHTNTKQHYCLICNKGFIQSQHLKSHMRTHEPERLLHCTVINCKKKFASESARKKHLASHNIESEATNISADSHCGITSKEVKVETILCTTCGKIIDCISYGEHQSKCLSTENEPEDLSICSPSEVIQKVITKHKPKSENSNILRNEDEIKDCQAILGRCIVNGDLDDCLCAQMKTPDDDQYDDMLIPNQSTSPMNTQTKEYNYDNYKITKEFGKTNCENCECGSMSLNEKYSGTASVIRSNTGKENLRSNNLPCNRNDTLPEIEYKNDGSIKLRDTFDHDIKLPLLANVEKNKKRNEIYSNFVLLNSCKAVLGKCIVSGNGTISDECLCAKMLADDQQMTEQEIDEITPQPNSVSNSSYLLSFS